MKKVEKGACQKLPEKSTGRKKEKGSQEEKGKKLMKKNSRQRRKTRENGKHIFQDKVTNKKPLERKDSEDEL